MYVIQLGPVAYDGFRDGTPFTLVSAMREIHGTRNARILRTDGAVVVDQAGSDYAVIHVPSGRTVFRGDRPGRHIRGKNMTNQEEELQR